MKENCHFAAVLFFMREKILKMKKPVTVPAVLRMTSSISVVRASGI